MRLQNITKKEASNKTLMLTKHMKTQESTFHLIARKNFLLGPEFIYLFTYSLTYLFYNSPATEDWLAKKALSNF